MAPPDDVEVDSDGDELLEWLWDFPERYDVGVEDPPLPPAALVGGVGVAAGAGLPEVRKHLRRPAGAPAIASGSADSPAAAVDDRPTVAMDPVESFEDDEAQTEFIPALAAGRERRRLAGWGVATAAAVLLVVAVGVGVGYTLFARSGSGKAAKASSLAISSATTTLPPPFDQGVVPPVVTTVASSDTTTSTPPTTGGPAGPAGPAGASAAAVVATGTTTTAPHCTSGCSPTTVHITPPTNPPPPPTTTTTTTRPPITTTSTTPASTTTSSSTSTSIAWITPTT